nr:hypothetical protein [uncultured Methanoregula sp.]
MDERTGTSCKKKIMNPDKNPMKTATENPETTRLRNPEHAGTSTHPEPGLTTEQINRAFKLFGTIIPAATADITRRRTAYFYRQQAIAWARMGRQYWPGGGDMQGTCCRLAKHYLAAYRQMITTRG